MRHFPIGLRVCIQGLQSFPLFRQGSTERENKTQRRGENKTQRRGENKTQWSVENKLNEEQKKGGDSAKRNLTRRRLHVELNRSGWLLAWYESGKGTGHGGSGLMLQWNGI